MKKITIVLAAIMCLFLMGADGSGEEPYWAGFDFGPNLNYSEEYVTQGDPGEYLSCAEAAKLVFDSMKAQGRIPEYSDNTEYTLVLVDLAEAGGEVGGEESYVYRLDVEGSDTIGAAYAYAYQSGNIYMRGHGGQWLKITAAEPDVNVTGLWLRVPAFPAADEAGRVEVLKFTDDREMDITMYSRDLDGMVTLEIMRGPIAESELQSPSDVEGLLEFRVYNEEDRSISDENWKSVEIDADASGLAKLISHPVATAKYITGANEDTRMNISMFVFTDVYRYEVWASLPIDSLERYQQDIQDWFESAQFVER